jgi:hypothetical protein
LARFDKLEGRAETILAGRDAKLAAAEKLVKPKGKHRNEMNLDNNERTGKNTAGRRNGLAVQDYSCEFE